MNGIRQYFKDIIEHEGLNPPKEVHEFVYAYEIRQRFFERELQKIIDLIYKLWEIDASCYDVINGGGCDNVVLVRECFSMSMRAIKKNKKQLYSFEDIGNFLNKKPHTIMHYCRSVNNSKKKTQLYNIFYKQYKKL